MWRLSPVNRPMITPGSRGEHADGAQVGQHPVDPVEILAHVFQEEQCAVEVGEVRRADEALEQGEVAAGERPFGHAAAHGDDAGSCCGNEHFPGDRQRLERGRPARRRSSTRRNGGG